MILTFKTQHNNNFSKQLSQAKKVAEFAIKNKDKLSSKYVKHFGLKSVIANQILRKYGKNKIIKKVSSVKLIIPNQGIKLNTEKQLIEIPSLKLSFNYEFKHQFSKVNQIEIDNQYYYVSVEVQEEKQLKTEGWLGVDRNTNGHCAVAACTKTNKVMMLGKQAKHIHEKYRKIRRKLQKLKKYNKLKTIKKRESNIVKNLNHKISKKIISYAKENNCGIKLEKLFNIRKNKKQNKSFRVHLNSWSYYQLEQFLLYKAKLVGVPVVYIDPAYTSQTCHKCGLIGDRNGKKFKCPSCGYTSHADVNASWNITNSEKLLIEPKSEAFKNSDSPVGVYNQRLSKEGDLDKGNADIPQRATVLNATDSRTSVALA